MDAGSTLLGGTWTVVEAWGGPQCTTDVSVMNLDTMPDSPSVEATGQVRNIVPGGNPEALMFHCLLSAQRGATANEYALTGYCSLGTQPHNGVTGSMSISGGCRHFAVAIDPSFPYDGSVCP